MEDKYIRLRKGRQSDFNMIIDNWKQSFRKGDMVRDLHPKFYDRMWQRVITELLSVSYVYVLARQKVDPETGDVDDNDCVGWICAQKTDDTVFLHYVYVKGWFRQQGFARQLMKPLLIDKPETVVYTHKTGLGRFALQWEKNKHPDNVRQKWEYNPFFVYDLMPKGWHQE